MKRIASFIRSVIVLRSIGKALWIDSYDQQSRKNNNEF